MSVDSRVSLIIPSLDLQLTRLLRRAMRSADAGSGRGESVTEPGPDPTAPPARGSHIDPLPEIEPRQRVEPAPRFEPRPVIGVCPCESRDVNVSPPPGEAPRDPEKPRLVGSPLEPPWKLLPWEDGAPPAPRVKVIVKPPEIRKTGAILDVFA